MGAHDAGSIKACSRWLSEVRATPPVDHPLDSSTLVRVPEPKLLAGDVIFLGRESQETYAQPRFNLVPLFPCEITSQGKNRGAGTPARVLGSWGDDEPVVSLVPRSTTGYKL